MSEFFDALETRDPAEREAALLRALPAPDGARAAGHGRLGGDPRRRRRRRHHIARGAGAPAGHAQARAAGAPAGPARPAIPSAASPRWCAGRPCRACLRSPGPIYEPEGSTPRLLAHRRARCLPRAFAPATWCTTASATTSRRRGFDDGNRRARDRLHRVPGRRRPDRAAAAGHRRTAARRLHRHAQLPAHPAGEGRTRPAPTSPACARRMVGGEAFPRQPARLVRASAASTSTRATPPPTSA